MPAIPYVRNPTWADGSGGGTAIDAADLNKLENGIYEVSYAPCVRVTHNANQTILNNTTTALAFNTERFDQAGNVADTMHDTVTNNSRLTCRYAGVYLITAMAEWTAAMSVNTQILIRLNNTTDIAKHAPVGIDYRSMHVSTMYNLAVNDYVECRVLQVTGASKDIGVAGNTSPEFMMCRVG